ncbi:hypothetical protein VOLCADRAFT_104625 [Volvox carteri f. nagariensis]|uniref:Methyltransferase domain-containing protein n=1 Tax=Volvox carteri f. nagariensis TaxID=3068 RepID=D8TUZ0_VOLCA|nr:uncharacterized protein VOLCADRAFT_104625 [Volvox carteri f. nagariensis]EFJ48796.1 hypothetical protein VOLCADRAFT_104625 [Volvox carteri f. nagariensis]|eukprot:XP_002950128.1 hypothetical protein VOLCADRAFT_104625 [Volvox carteri f. nagariensis]
MTQGSRGFRPIPPCTLSLRLAHLAHRIEATYIPELAKPGAHTCRRQLALSSVPAPARSPAPTGGEATPSTSPSTAPASKPERSAAGGAAAAVPDDWRQEVIAALAQAEGFAELTIRTKAASAAAQSWHTVTARPVLLGGTRHLQVTTFTVRQSTSVNHPLGLAAASAAGPGGTAAVAAVDAVVRPLLEAGGLGSVTLRTSSQDLTVQITKRGKGIVHRGAPQSRPALVTSEPGRALSHDRTKDTPIPANQPHPFLQRIGFQTADGRIRANMQDKFSQVNEFLKLLGHTGFIQQQLQLQQQQQQQQRAGAIDGATAPEVAVVAATATAGRQFIQEEAEPGGGPRRALHILDCGCGSSHLTFGTYHYLNHVLGLQTTLTGVDVNGALMTKANEHARQLGLQGARFDTAPIGQYSPAIPPDIVLALHACDTATDDALALAVKQGSPLILAVPCCHAHLHKQLSGRTPTSRPPWSPLLRHGILKQRQLDLLTDSLRAQLLRVAGYRTDVVEFVSTEHTPRNLLIRAVRQQQVAQQQSKGPAVPSPSPSAVAPPPPPPPPPPSWRRQQLSAAREYLALRDYWGVTPRLEDEDARRCSPQSGGAEHLHGLLFNPGMSTPVLATAWEAGPPSSPAIRPQRLNRLYLKPPVTAEPSIASSRVPSTTIGDVVYPSIDTNGSSTQPATVLATPANPGGSKSIDNVSANTDGILCKSRGGSGSGGTIIPSRSGRSSKRLAPVNLRVTPSHVRPPQVDGSMTSTAAAAAAAVGAVANASCSDLHGGRSNHGSALEPLFFHSDDGERSMTIIADDPDLLMNSPSGATYQETPAKPPFAASEATTIPITMPAAFTTNAGITATSLMRGAVHRPTARSAPAVAESTAVDVEGYLPLAVTTRSQAAAVKPPGHVHDDLDMAQLPVQGDGNGRPAPSLVPAGHVRAREAAVSPVPPAGADCEPQQLPGTDAVVGSHSTEVMAHAVAGGTCRIRMKLHSSNPEQLRPSMLAPLARLLLPYSWALQSVAARPGCLELVLDYTMLENVAVQLHGRRAGDASTASGLAAAAAADPDAMISDGQVAELLSYLQCQGLVDPSQEPMVTVQVNQQLRRLQWQGHEPQAALTSPRPGPSDDLLSWCTGEPSSSHTNTTAVTTIAASATAGMSERPALQTSGGWFCHAGSGQAVTEEVGLTSTQPDAAPVCLVAPCVGPAAAAVLYVAVPCAGLHTCTVRCLGCFLPVQQLQRLSTAAIHDTAAAAAAGMPRLGMDWADAVDLAAAAAGAEGDVLIIQLDSLPRHSTLLQVELRMGGKSLKDGAAAAGAVQPLQQAEEEHQPPMPAQLVTEPLSAAAPVLFLRACACDRDEVCRCSCARRIRPGWTSMVGGSVIDRDVNESGCGVLSMATARGVAAELKDLKTRILASRVAGAAQSSADAHALASAAPVPGTSAAAAAAGELDEIGAAAATAAIAVREFISDLGLLLDTAACVQLQEGEEEEEDDEEAAVGNCLSYNRVIRGLLLQRLGFAGSGAIELPDDVSGAAIDGSDSTTAQFRQHLADTAVTLLAGCLELSLPYTARLVSSCSAGQLRLCSEDVLVAAVAVDEVEVAARLENLLRFTDPPCLPQKSPQPLPPSPPSHRANGTAAGSSGDVRAIVIPRTATPLASSSMHASTSSTLPQVALSGKERQQQHRGAVDATCSGGGAADGAAVAAVAVGSPAVAPLVSPSVVAFFSPPAVAGAAPVDDSSPTRPPLRPSLSTSLLLEHQHAHNVNVNSSVNHFLSQRQGRNGVGIEFRHSSGPGFETGSGFPGPNTPGTSPGGLVQSLSGSVAVLQGPHLRLRPPAPGQDTFAVPSSLPSLPSSAQTQPLRYRRFSRVLEAVAAAAGGAEARVQTESEGRSLGLDPVLTTGRLVGSGTAGGDAPAHCAEQEDSFQSGQVDRRGAQEQTLVGASPVSSSCVKATAVSQWQVAAAATGPPPPLPPHGSSGAPAGSSGTTTFLGRVGSQVLACLTGFASPHMEQAFWQDTTIRLQAMCRLYAGITLVFVSLSVGRAFIEDGLPAAAFMALYQGGQALLLAVFGLLGDGRPERLFGAVVTCTGLRAVCHSLLSRGLAPLPSFVLPLCHMGVDVFNEAVAKAVFEQLPVWLFLTLLIFLELPTAYALYYFLDGHGQGLLARCLLLRLAVFGVLRTAVVIGIQAAWRVQFLARRAAQAKRD